MELDLRDRVVLVTGASRGIGAAVALAFAEEGCDVALNHWRDAEAAEEVAERIGALGRRTIACEMDVADAAAAASMVQRVIAELGRLDVLVCNAGTHADHVVWKMPEEDWDRVIAVNLKGCFNFCRAVAPVFKEQGHGRIVNVASINGLRGKFGQSNYAASKAGVVALTKCVAKELGGYDVNVNAVAPGMVATEMTQSLPERFVRQAVDETALGRIADPDDVARVVVFLASSAARHITGQCIPIDGGQYT